MRKLVLGLITITLLAFAGTASAAQEKKAAAADQSSVTGLSVWGILGYAGWGGADLGLGARFAIPAGSAGLFKGTNVDIYEEFAVELGADAMFFNYYDYHAVSILPTAGVMWVFWLLDGKLGLYPKIDLYYGITMDNIPGYTGYWSGINIDGLGGLIWKTGNFSLRAEGGSVGLRLGLALNF